VDAQTTKFIALSYPRYVERGTPEPVVVELTVSYQDAKPGMLLVVSLFDDEKQDYLKGTATGSPDPCILPPAPTVNTSCVVRLQVASGRSHVTFRFSATDNPHALGVWRFLVGSELEYSDGQVINGSFFAHRFSVAVIEAVTIVTTSRLLTTVSSTGVFTGFGGILSSIVAVVIVVGLAAVSMTYLIHRLRRRSRHAS